MQPHMGKQGKYGEVMMFHKIYCFDLRPEKKYVDKQTVIQYVNNLPPQRLMYSINYPTRKKNIESTTGTIAYSN